MFLPIAGMLSRLRCPKVAELNDEERQLSRRNINRVPEKTSPLTPEERTRRLNAALDAMGDGLSQDQLNEMTEEYIEEWDESEWAE